MSVYENVCLYANKKNIPIYLLEQKAGLGNGTIGKWKDGEATIGSLKKVADALGVDVKKLI